MSFGGSLFGGASSSTPASSAGGFGNLFSNAANTANASKPATPSLFGTSNTTTSAPGGGGLFGSAQPSTTPAITLQPPGSGAPTTNLFGNTAATPAPATGGLFGNTGANNSAPAAGGLFGSTNTTSAAPSGGLFGNAAASTAAPGGGLFGNANANAASAAPSGGLFGSAAGSTAPASGGLFGASNTASQPAASSSLFGVAQPAQGGSSLFGGSATNNNAANQTQAQAQPNSTYKPLFGSLGAATTQQPQQANQTQQQPQVVKGVRIDLSNVKPTTRFYELHESLQNEIIQAEEFIQSQINLITQCSVFMPAHGISLATIAPDVKFVKNTLDTVSLALSRDAAEINAVKSTVHQDAQDCTRAFTAIEHLKLPAQWQYSQAWGGASGANDSSTGGGIDGDNVFAATDMVPYFNRQTREVDERLAHYKSQMAEIEAHLRTVEGSAVDQMRRVLQRQASGEQQERGQVAELASAMHVFEEAVLRVAGKVGETREGVIECTIGRPHVNGSSSRR